MVPSSSLFFHFARGLCSVYRSEAGQIVGQEDDFCRHNNSHWLPRSEDGRDFQPRPSRTVAYYDAASLYPSSGEFR